jgi:hypothetical protein
MKNNKITFIGGGLAVGGSELLLVILNYLDGIFFIFDPLIRIN